MFTLNGRLLAAVIAELQARGVPCQEDDWDAPTGLQHGVRFDYSDPAGEYSGYFIPLWELHDPEVYALACEGRFEEIRARRPEGWVLDGSHRQQGQQSVAREGLQGPS